MSIVDRLIGRSGDEPEAPDDVELDPLESGLDDLFYILSNSRRRYVIDIVADLGRGEMVTLRELATGLTYVEEASIESIEAVPGDDRKSRYVVLYQNHIPVLDDSGVIECVDSKHNIRRTGTTAAYQKLIRTGYRQANDLGWSA